MNKAPDEPNFEVFENLSRRGLVYVGIGTGTDGFNVTPDTADELAAQLIGAAASARAAGR